MAWVYRLSLAFSLSSHIFQPDVQDPVRNVLFLRPQSRVAIFDAVAESPNFGLHPSCLHGHQPISPFPTFDPATPFRVSELRDWSALLTTY